MKLVPSSCALFLLVTTLTDVLVPRGFCDAAAAAGGKSKTPEELRSVLRKHRRILDDAATSNPPTTINDGSDNVSGDGIESVSDGVTDTGDPCFSSMNMVRVQGRSQQQQQERVISIQQLQVGDYVRDGHDDDNNNNDKSFSRVISLAHLDHTMETEFMQIYTTAAAANNNNKSPPSPPLEITKKHMLFVKEKGKRGGTFVPVRAEKVSVGDILVGGSSRKEVVVSDIQYITRTGVYAPITASGTILVGGIQASSYFDFFDFGAAATTTTTTAMGGRMHKMMNPHYLAHYYFAPHRVLCAVDFSRYCQHEQHDSQGYSTNFGIPTVLRLLRWCNEFVVPLQVFLALCAYPLLVSCYLAEQLIAVVSSSSSLVTIIGAFVLGRKMIRIVYKNKKSRDKKRKQKVL